MDKISTKSASFNAKKAGSSGKRNTGCSPKSKVKILIIGAGMAGLSAANHLLQKSCENFLILEARTRIGGRIISIPIGAQKVELGANWIHGVLGNPIFEIAVQNGLVSVVNIPKPHKVVARTEDGTQIPFTFLQEIYEAYVCFLRRCDEYFLCQYAPPADINSVGEHINYEIELYLSSITDSKEKRLKRLIFNCLLKRETCITGCTSMNEIDLLELGSYTELQGGNIVLPSGYSSILEPLTARIPKDSIITNCPVKEIHWKSKGAAGNNLSDENSDSGDDSGGTITEFDQGDETDNDAGIERTSAPCSNSKRGKEDQNHQTVRVVCEDGRVFYAEYVLCTVPLGVLKRSHSTLFHPQLPQYKQECIEKLMFGTVDKIFLEFERPFLKADITEIMLLWDDEKYELEASSGQSEEEYIRKNWYRKIYSFVKLSETLLLGWISGREAEYMETLSHECVGQKCTEILRDFLKDTCIPSPMNCICTSWKSQPFTCGSYTSIPVGATQDDIVNLSEPLYYDSKTKKPAVLFAGEHVHSNFYSTVHGAYLSGRTAAQFLLDDEESQEIVMEPDGSDLSDWVKGISLE